MRPRGVDVRERLPRASPIGRPGTFVMRNDHRNCAAASRCERLIERIDDLIGLVTDVRGVHATRFTDDRSNGFILFERYTRGLTNSLCRLIRLYNDPQRRSQLEEERAYLQDYVVALGQISGEQDSKFKAFRRHLEGLLAEGHRVIGFDRLAAEAFASEDLGEGIGAFRERRTPRFKGR